MIAVIASMQREVSGLVDKMARANKGARFREPGEQPVLVYVTGVGKEKTLAGISALLDRPVRPECILSLGFAGALRDGLGTGDLVLSRRLYATGEDAFLESDVQLLNLAEEVLNGPGAPRYFIADTMTVPRILLSAKEKEHLASSSTSWVANMEDYWIGKAAAQQEIPFLSVRAVLDTAHQELPPFIARIGDQGLLRQVVHSVANGISRPRYMPWIIQMAKQVKVAQNSLVAFGLSFVDRMVAAGRYA